MYLLRSKGICLEVIGYLKLLYEKALSFNIYQGDYFCSVSQYLSCNHCSSCCAVILTSSMNILIKIISYSRGSRFKGAAVLDRNTYLEMMVTCLPLIREEFMEGVEFWNVYMCSVCVCMCMHVCAHGERRGALVHFQV